MGAKKIEKKKGMMHFGKFSISHKGRQNESFLKKKGRGGREKD